jgi:hypothetical protein
MIIQFKYIREINGVVEKWSGIIARGTFLCLPDHGVGCNIASQKTNIGILKACLKYSMKLKQ